VKRIIIGGVVALATLIGSTIALPAQAATGTFTEYDLGVGDIRASGITNGPDGAMWFTEFAAQKIGRITTSGAITTFDVPSSSDLQQITAANDGNLWFTVDSPGDQIGRITPTGTVTDQFDVTGAGNGVEFITTGSDGNLWFLAQAGNTLSRLTPAGALTVYPLPQADSAPTKPITGPDGALWFTEANRIGRFEPPAAVTTTTTGGSTTTAPATPAVGVTTTPAFTG